MISGNKSFTVQGERMKKAFGMLLILLLSNPLQAADPESGTPHITDALFAPDRLIQVEVTMAPEDWQALRVSHRITGEDFSQVVENLYEYYPASVVIDS